jgi:hypothetical protein
LWFGNIGRVSCGANIYYPGEVPNVSLDENTSMIKLGWFRMIIHEGARLLVMNPG